MKAQKRTKKSKILKLDDAIKNLPEKIKLKLEESRERNRLYVRNAVVITFHKPATQTLYYRESPANDGLVFAEPERAKHIARVHHALESSRTWGEFKRKLPSEEYDYIVSVMFDYAEDQWPNDSAPFNSEDVPGYCDGDYPAWLQQKVDECVPEEILDKYAENLETTLNGNYYHIEGSDEEAICRDLRALGFQVIRREDLYFY
jgi:hypothetical protein